MFQYYVKLGWRHIVQTPVLSSLIVIAIALGIGVSMTMISYYKAMAADPSGDKSSKLFAVQLAAYGNDLENWGGMPDGIPRQLTHTDTSNLRLSNTNFSKTPMYQFQPVIQSRREGVGPSGEYRGRMVDSDFFAMFDLEFIYGTAWGKSVDIEPAKQVVISRSLNDWAFGGGNTVGKTLVMHDGVSEFTVVGVVENWDPQPAYYDLTTGFFPSRGPEVFVPFSLTSTLEAYPMGNISGWMNADINSYSDFIKSEYVWQVFWVQLNSEDEQREYENYMAGYVEQQQALGRFANPNPRYSLRNVAQWLEYNQVISEDNRVMVGLSLLFLLVCLVNTVGLLMAKFLRKMNEAGIRRALGANRVQIFNQYLIEVGILGFLGGALGLLLAYGGLWVVRLLYKTDIAQLDIPLMFGALALSLVAACLTGIFPALRVCRANPSLFLKAQ